MPKPRFPAPYTPAVVDAMLPRLQGIRGVWLDPFAGMGMSLPRFVGPGHTVVGVEIEQPNVDAGIANGAAGLLEQGDATALRFRKGSVAAIFTSCTYGNRFADSHKANERCRACKGTGKVGRRKCEKCGGEGRRHHTRRSYTHDIRELTGDPNYELAENNSGRMHFGPDYIALHEHAWAEAWRVAKPGAVLLLNVSDFIREDEIVHVSTWHLRTLQAIGFVWFDAVPIPTPRMRYGANSNLRVENEWLFGFRKPAAR